jgi:HAD superfamily hydrolase (TIGR01549 family)
MIKALIFDCFGVFYTDPVFAYMRDPNTLKEIGQSLHKLDELAARGELPKSDFIDLAKVLLNKSQEDIERQFFVGSDLNSDLVDFAKKARKNYKTALLSNIGADMMGGFFPQLLLDELFDVTILSGAVKMAKPDPEIYQLVCDRLNIRLDEAVMIDDSANSIETADKLGMHSILYKDYAKFLDDITQILAQT